VDLHFVEGDRQQLAQLRAPVGAFTRLGILFVGAAIDEVDFGFEELHLRYYRMVVPQRMPTDGQVDQRCVDERHRDLAVDLDDLQAVDLVRTAPQGQVDIGDLPAVVAHVGQFVIQIVAHQVWQGDVQGYQQHSDSGEDPQRPAVATLHGGNSRTM